MSIATSASLPTLVFAAFATLAVAGCGVDLALDDDTSRRVEHDTVPADGLRRVGIATENGEVRIRGGGDDEVVVRTELGEHHEGDAEYTIDVDGDRLVLEGECDAGRWNGCTVGFVVTVPPDFDVDVETGNGRVELADVDGEVEVSTDNGAIEADRIGGGPIDARTDNGRIRLTFDQAPASVSATTDNGAIDVRLPELEVEYAVDADSDNGAVDVDVRTGPTADRVVSARSDNGAIEIGYRTVAD